jgi:hypothetical protein
MQDYAVFGGCLRSDIPFPELHSLTARQPTWTLRTYAERAHAPDMVLIGEDALPNGVGIRAFRSPSSFRLEYDDTGTYDVAAAGTDIRWTPGPRPTIDDVRLDILGRVLPLALHAAGVLCLHGSAVALAGGGIAFIAPKMHGKSTLAMAMVTGGARLVTDDALPVVIPADASPVAFRPGVHRMRLKDDSIDQLGGDRLRSGLIYEYKHLLAHLPREQVANEEVPAAALYMVAPVESLGASGPVRRTRITPVRAAMMLLQHLKVGSVLGRSEAAVVLDQCITLARRVPLYHLEVVKGFDHLPHVTAQLMRWHGSARSTSPLPDPAA